MRRKPILVLFLALFLGMKVFAYDFCIDGIYYTIYNNDYAKVVSGEEKYKGAIRIPSEVVYNDVTYKVM